MNGHFRRLLSASSFFCIVFPTALSAQELGCQPESKDPIVAAIQCNSAPPSLKAATVKEMILNRALEPEPDPTLTITDLNTMVVHDAPPIQAGDLLFLQVNRADFALDVKLTNGKWIRNVRPPERQTATLGVVGWRPGKVQLDQPWMIGERIISMRVTPLGKSGPPLLFRGITLNRHGRTILTFEKDQRSSPQTTEASELEPPISHPRERVPPQPHLEKTSLKLSSGVAARGSEPDFKEPSLVARTFALDGEFSAGGCGVPNHHKWTGHELDAGERGFYGMDVRYRPDPGRFTSSHQLSSASTTSYAVNSSNELTPAGAVSYTYDDNGNLLSKTDSTGTTSYTWDFENRLTSVKKPDGTTVTFKYDPFGRRIQKSGPLGTTNLLYDGSNLIAGADANGNIVGRYVHGPGVDEPLAVYTGSTMAFYQADGLGSITSLSTPAGTLSDTLVYDSFGNLISSTGSFTQPFRYTGREFDVETGLYYYRARYYDPAAGRFLSEDPIRFNSGDVNFYGYVENNPINAADPDGQKTKVCCRLLLGIMGILTRQRHCFLIIDPEDGRPPLVLGLHKNITLHGVFYPGGHVFPNFLSGDDSGKGADKARAKDCVNVDGTVCKDRQMYDNYTSAPCAACGDNYKLLGPNSNTFVSDFLRYFQVVPPHVKRAPGY
jgi:RHS repeat-associated protein